MVAAAGSFIALVVAAGDSASPVEPAGPTTVPPRSAAPAPTSVGAATGGVLPIPIADLLPEAVLAHAQPLPEANGFTYYAIATADLAAADPEAHAALLAILESFPTVDPADPRLEVAPLVVPGDIAVALRREGDQVVELVVRCSEPAISVALP